MDAHRQPKGTAGLRLVNCAMTRIDDYRLAADDISDRATFTATLIRLGHFYSLATEDIDYLYNTSQLVEKGYSGSFAAQPVNVSYQRRCRSLHCTPIRQVWGEVAVCERRTAPGHGAAKQPNCISALCLQNLRKPAIACLWPANRRAWAWPGDARRPAGFAPREGRSLAIGL